MPRKLTISELRKELVGHTIQHVYKNNCESTINVKLDNGRTIALSGGSFNGYGVLSIQSSKRKLNWEFNDE